MEQYCQNLRYATNEKPTVSGALAKVEPNYTEIPSSACSAELNSFFLYILLPENQDDQKIFWVVRKGIKFEQVVLIHAFKIL